MSKCVQKTGTYLINYVAAFNPTNTYISRKVLNTRKGDSIGMLNEFNTNDQTTNLIKCCRKINQQTNKVKFEGDCDRCLCHLVSFVVPGTVICWVYVCHCRFREGMCHCRFIEGICYLSRGLPYPEDNPVCARV